MRLHPVFLAGMIALTSACAVQAEDCTGENCAAMQNAESCEGENCLPGDGNGVESCVGENCLPPAENGVEACDGADCTLAPDQQQAN